MGTSKQFGAGFTQAFNDIRTPDVLADRQADPHATNFERPRHRPGIKHALFVKDPVIGQINLEANAGDSPAIEHRIGVVEFVALLPGQTDHHRRAAIGCFMRQRIKGGAACINEGRFGDEILRRIARQKQLREHDNVRTSARGFGARKPRPREIAGDVAHDGVELRERKAEAGSGCVHAPVM